MDEVYFLPFGDARHPSRSLSKKASEKWHAQRLLKEFDVFSHENVHELFLVIVNPCYFGPECWSEGQTSTPKIQKFCGGRF